METIELIQNYNFFWSINIANNYFYNETAKSNTISGSY